MGPEDPVLVSDTSSEGRVDEEEEGDRVEKTPSPKPNEEEAISEIEKGSASSVPPSNAGHLALVPTNVEGPTVPVAEDTQDPPVLSVLTGDGNVQSFVA